MTVGLVSVLLVSVSVVARPTRVSVLVGNVNVPVLLIELMTGVVSVLLVSVCTPVSVATVESMAIVTAAEPLYEVPDRPVPIVNALVAVAVTVPEPPNEIAVPLTVTELLVSEALPMFDSVLLAPEIVLLVSV